MDSKKYEEINSNELFIQKWFILYMINKKNITENSTIFKYFFDTFGINLKLTKSQISKLKNKYLDEFKGLDFIQLLEKVKNNIPNLFVKIYDVTYEIEIKNKSISRNNRIIFFGLEDNLKIINKDNTEEFFADTTFKIIPAKLRPYKLFVISGIPKSTNIPKIFTLILTKYSDHITYGKMFDYLFVNYEFKPKILHTDFENALSLALKENSNFKNNVIHTRCFFHFSNMLKKNLSKTGLFKKKLNKLSIEIISNLELLCFIRIDKIKELQSNILNKLEQYKGLTKFINYLKKFLFNLSPKVYNYHELIEHFKNNGSNKFLEKLYTTNNICESLNSKFSFYLPKKESNNYNFVCSISSILSNDLLDNNKKIYRKDMKTKCLIKLIDDLDYNNNLEWVSYDTIKKYLKEIINKNIENEDDEQIENIINYVAEEDEERINISDNNYNLKNEEEKLSKESNVFNNDKNEDLKDGNLDEIDELIKEDDKEYDIKIENQNNNSIEESESDNEDVNIINTNENDYDKLIDLFNDVNIEDEEKNENWFKNPLKERISILAKNKKKNNKIKKKKITKKITYPKDSD